MSATATAVTPDDLLRRPDDGKGFELVAGRLIERVTGVEAGQTAGRIMLALMGRVASPLWVSTGYPFRCFHDHPDTLRRPSVAGVLYTRCTLPDDADYGSCPLIPDFVAEVASTGQKAYDMHGRIDEWLTAGVPCLWEVYPSARKIRAYQKGRPAREFRSTDSMTIPDVLPGFAVPVADLFRRPGS